MITKENRIMFFLSATAGFLGGALSLILLIGPIARAQNDLENHSGIVRAEEFQLVDKSGRTRSTLAFSGTGHPYLAMLDQRGTRIVWLGLSDDPGLAIRDIDGKTRVVLSLDRTGEPSLVVRDRQHRTRSFSPE